MKGRRQRSWQQQMGMSFLVIIFGIVFFAGLLYFLQHKLIYYPRAYAAEELEHLPQALQEIEYATDQGRQVSYFYPSAHDSKGDLGSQPRLWVLFGGNASRALDWLGFIAGYPDPDAGFLLIDYPGYGNCEGKALPGSILDSSVQALQVLSRKLPIYQTEQAEISVLGHSIGAAAALQFAVNHPVKKAVLVSPFTSLRDMARRSVGPLSVLLGHDFDNRARLKQLLKNVSVSVSVLHGERDDIIPVYMGRELVSINPQRVVYREILDGDHNTLLFTAKREIWEAMLN